MIEHTAYTDSDIYRLGETSGEHAVWSREEARDAALALARQARLSLRIFTRHLDAELFSNTEFRDAVSELARRGPRTGVRILVQDPSPALRRHHALLDLIQRLSSHIGVRRVGRDWEDEIFAFVLADEQGVFWRPYGDQFEGSIDFAAGPRGRGLRVWFDTVWEASTPDPEMRRLGI